MSFPAILILVISQSLSANPAAFRGAQQSKTQPVTPPELERSIKGFLYALYSGDSSDYQKWILPEPGSNDLIGAQHLTAQQLEDLRREVNAIQLRQASQFTADGKEVGAVSGSNYPVGTKTSYMTEFRGS